jgi:hypothetical protein
MSTLWVCAAWAAMVYCVARTIVDFRQRKYVWALFGAVSALAFLLTPVETHAVKLDFPAPTSR